MENKSEVSPILKFIDDIWKLRQVSWSFLVKLSPVSMVCREFCSVIL